MLFQIFVIIGFIVITDRLSEIKDTVNSQTNVLCSLIDEQKTEHARHRKAGE